MNIDLLKRVAGAIAAGREIVGSRWQKDEAEVIACQTICSCWSNYAKHGDAFTWYGNGMSRSDGLGLANNPVGLQLLIDDRCVVVEAYDGELKPPSRTYHDGAPMILRVTDRLLEYAATMCGVEILAGD